MRRLVAFVVAVAAVAVVACNTPTAPVEVKPVQKKVASWECRSGVVIHVGRDSVCVEDGN